MSIHPKQQHALVLLDNEPGSDSSMHYGKYGFLARLVSNLRGIIVLVVNSKHLVILKLKNISAIVLHAKSSHASSGN